MLVTAAVKALGAELGSVKCDKAVVNLVETRSIAIVVPTAFCIQTVRLSILER
jgi:hypothetical protein